MMGMVGVKCDGGGRSQTNTVQLWVGSFVV